MKQPFALQVAVVVLLLLAGLVCIPLPGGGMLFHRLTGRAPESAPAATPSAPTITEIATHVAAVPATSPPQHVHVSSARFKDELPLQFEIGAGEDDMWVWGFVNGKTAWLDGWSHMIWGPKLDISLPDLSEASLKTAKEACAAQEPKGSWALPTAAEFDIAKVNGIVAKINGIPLRDTDAQHRWITYMEVNGLTLPAGRGYIAVSVEKEFSVRCVGRSSSAPAEGYSQTTNEITIKAMTE